MDVSADDIEDHVDPADVVEILGGEVEELVRAEVERRLAVRRPPSTDDVGAELPGKLRNHRPDRAGGAVCEDALPRLKTTVLEQTLPRGQAGDRQARTHREVDVPRQRRQVACLHGRVLGQGSIAVPVRDPEHPLSQREPRRAVAEGGDHSGELMADDRLGSIATGAIDPRRGPLPLRGDEARRMDFNDDVVDRRRRLRPLRECDPGCFRARIRRDDCLHWYLRISRARRLCAPPKPWSGLISPQRNGNKIRHHRRMDH